VQHTQEDVPSGAATHSCLGLYMYSYRRGSYSMRDDDRPPFSPFT